tara:strand:- start:46 stop:765 length:720 start_codon:yes stop_codon:yes gene_type:complete
MPFKKVRVSPILDLDAYSNNDLVFDLTEIPLPIKGACLLTNITIVNRTTDDNIDMGLIFLNNNSTSFGALNQGTMDVTYMEARDRVLGFIETTAIRSTGSTDWDNFFLHTTMVAADATGDAKNRIFNGMILEPESGSSSVYFAAIDSNEAPTYAGVTGVLVNGAVSAGASDTVAVDDVSALLHFKVGDTVVDADDNVVGIIKSLTATSIVFESVTGEALANNEALFTPHSLEFIFDIEY